MGPAATAGRRAVVLLWGALSAVGVSALVEANRLAHEVLPAALGMAGVLVCFDVLAYGTVAVVVDRFRRALRPRLLRTVERATGAVLLGVGLRLATEAR